MKRLWSAIFGSVLLAGALALAGDDVPAPPTLLDSTTGVVVIEVDGIPQQLMFVSTSGQVALVSPSDCHREPACEALGQALVKAGKVSLLNLVGSKQT